MDSMDIMKGSHCSEWILWKVPLELTYIMKNQNISCVEFISMWLNLKRRKHKSLESNSFVIRLEQCKAM